MGLLLAVSAGGCDSGGDASGPVPTAPAPPPEPAPPPPPAEPLFELPTSYEGLTSYEMQTSALLTDWGALVNSRWCPEKAVAYGDFDGDGDEDTFVAEVSMEEGPHWVWGEDPVPVNMFLNEGPAGFRLADEIFRGPVPRMVSPRKALPGDFNGDGRLDIFVAGHGYDAPPFPGESPLLILSTERGLQAAPGLEQHFGFFHGAASGDVDNDGDVDIVVTNHNFPFTFLLLNDGSGSFSFDQSRLPDVLNQDKGIYTVELLDVDGDLWLDLLIAGHEWDEPWGPGWPNTIYWGDSSGTYEDSRKTVLPAVEGWGVVVDIDAEDLDGDGNREIILDRTMSEPFYDGFHIQVLTGLGEREFEDETDRWITDGTNTETTNWLDWLRVVDLNGDGWLDLFADTCLDHGRNWLNDGTGHLRPGPPIP